MKSLYLRIYLTVVAVLLLFALAAGWVAQRNIAHERALGRGLSAERLEAWAELAQNNLPPPGAPVAQQRAAVIEWSQRLRVPLALDAADGSRIATSDSFVRRESREDGAMRSFRLALDDGRALWVARPGAPRGAGRPGTRAPPPSHAAARFIGSGSGLLLALVVLFLAVAAGAWPVVRRLTRRLEALQHGVEAFGAGALHQRVREDGRDEVAAVAASFNRAAARIEALVHSHQSLLANASHELRSPLARLKMALALLVDAPPAQRRQLEQEIHTNIAELDALVEEVLLASRLDALQRLDHDEPVDLLALAAEEGARLGVAVEGEPLQVEGDERLLRRALRNLLENGNRHAPGTLELVIVRSGAHAQVRVCDRGPGVPEGARERIFEPFYRLPGHAEQAGGVGLGLSIVRQIAERHGGSVRCEERDGGGSCFVLSLPMGRATGAARGARNSGSRLASGSR